MTLYITLWTNDQVITIKGNGEQVPGFCGDWNSIMPKMYKRIKMGELKAFIEFGETASKKKIKISNTDFCELYKALKSSDELFITRIKELLEAFDDELEANLPIRVHNALQGLRTLLRIRGNDVVDG
jgi:hypothetical protein